MFSWVTRLLRERQRRIFTFWDGRQWQRVDPMVVSRRYDSHPEFSWESTPLLADGGDLDAVALCAAATRDAFGLPEFDGSKGLTELELLSLLEMYVTYLLEQKKNTSDSLTSSERTAPESSAD